MNVNEFKNFADNNLLTKQEAMEITKQGLSAFNQSVETGRLLAFYDHGKGRGRVRLYLRSDVEKYAISIEERRGRLL